MRFTCDVRVRFVTAIGPAAGLKAISAHAHIDSNSEGSSLRCYSLLRPAEGREASWTRRHGWRLETRKKEDHLDLEDTLILPSLCPAVCLSVHFAAIRFAVILCPGRSKAARGSTVGGEMLQNGTVLKTQ